jgi:hypothetical protein
MAKYVDEDEFTDFQALVFVIVMVALLGVIYFCYKHMKEDVRKTECEGIYDTLDCRVNKQIREDLQAERLALKKRVDAIKSEQRKVGE